MTRVVFFALLAAGVVSASASRADVDVAPPPREVRPDGSRDPAPEATPPKQEDPREVVERIIKNSNAVGDKLAMTDTGTDTRKTQDTILKDIDALLNQHDDSSKSGQDQNPDMNNKDMQNKSDSKDKKDDMMPMGGMDQKDKKDKKDMGMGGGMDQQPMGGDNQAKGHRPRQQQGDKQPKDPGSNQANGKPEPKPMSGIPPTQPPKNPGGARPDPMGDPHAMARPAVPFEDDPTKDVWGHLPAKVRQQAMQYYKQEFMPRYAELLKHYYSSLSEKDKK
jgi:hypothetical protein